MLEKFALILFSTILVSVIYTYNNTEIVIYQCSKADSYPYFLGTEFEYKTLKNKDGFIKESECTSQKMIRSEWSKVKFAFKNTRGVQ